MGTELSAPLVKPEVPDPIKSAVSPEILSKLQLEMNGLESKLLALDPLMKDHLRETHRLLISYPETVHLLTDEGVARLIQAAQKHMQVQIISDAAKGKGSKKKVSLDDL